MLSRSLQLLPKSSVFLFGPRGTGKTTFLKRHYPDALYLDLLEADLYNKLLANPGSLSELLPADKDQLVILDEIQETPRVLNEVHRLIEAEKRTFLITGSNPRKLKKQQANLLAGRALRYQMYPLTISELGETADLRFVLESGLLPSLHDDEKDLEPSKYLASYVQTFLKEEVQQEGLSRRLSAFARFLEVASFSQGQLLEVSNVAKESAVPRSTIEGYFQILEDMLLATRLPVFAKKAKRKLVAKSKFYYFDVGVYQKIKPSGLLDRESTDDGVIIESLVFQDLAATINNFNYEYELGFWRTSGKSGFEVDFVLYGQSRLIAIEVKSSKTVLNKDLRGLKKFKEDYGPAELYLFYTGPKQLEIGEVTVLPLKQALLDLPELIRPT